MRSCPSLGGRAPLCRPRGLVRISRSCAYGLLPKKSHLTSSRAISVPPHHPDPTILRPKDWANSIHDNHLWPDFDRASEQGMPYTVVRVSVTTTPSVLSR